MCCESILGLIEAGYPIFNLRSALSYIADNAFVTPCKQCVVIENGVLSICGRCVDIPGLCEQCGYFFAAEYTLAFNGNWQVIKDMLRSYPKLINS
ncbi:MAG: hypothetical protein FWD45_05040 [Coriobacteriia bacterium]|nr:hypothetical protein [Coriobacteriia bacterium]